jgi:hypothetical protein
MGKFTFNVIWGNIIKTLTNPLYKFMAKTNNRNYKHSYKHPSWRLISQKDSSIAPRWMPQDPPHIAEVDLLFDTPDTLTQFLCQLFVLLPDKLTSSEPVNKFPTFHTTQLLISVFITAHHWSFSHFNPVKTITPLLIWDVFNTILRWYIPLWSVHVTEGKNERHSQLHWTTFSLKCDMFPLTCHHKVQVQICEKTWNTAQG